jgi:hypothetical protein
VPSVLGQQVRGGRLWADGRRRPRHGRRWRRGARAKRFARQPGHLAVAEVSAVVAVARSELLRRRLQGRTRSQSEPGPRTAAPTGRWEGLQNWGLRVIQLSFWCFRRAASRGVASSAGFHPFGTCSTTLIVICTLSIWGDTGRTKGGKCSGQGCTLGGSRAPPETIFFSRCAAKFAQILSSELIINF